MPRSAGPTSVRQSSRSRTGVGALVLVLVAATATGGTTPQAPDPGLPSGVTPVAARSALTPTADPATAPSTPYRTASTLATVTPAPAVPAARRVPHVAAVAADCTVPSAPTGITATAGRNAATVSWSTAADNGSAITAYVVTAVVAGTAGVAGATPPGATSTTLTGLAGGAATRLTVRAVSVCGDGDAATSAAVTPTGSATTYAGAVVGSAPVAYYRLGEAVGSTIGADSSGRAPEAAYSNTPTLGTAPGALAPADPDTAITGTRACCSAPAAAAAVLPQLNASRTVEAWVRPTDGSIGYLAGWGRNDTRQAFDVGVQDSTVVVDYYGDSTSFPAGRSLVDGAWHHVAVTWNGSRLTAYVDGAVIGARTLSAGLVTRNDSGLLIGAFHNGASTFYGGLDELAVYDRALDAATVAAHVAASGRARPTAPQRVTATPGGDNEAVVTWAVRAPTTPAVDTYVVTAIDDAGKRGLSTVVDGRRTAARVTGLTGARSYRFVVSARNSLGAGPDTTSTEVLTTGPATAYASVVRADAPAAYYRLGESETVGSGADSSGNGALLDYGRTPVRADGAIVGDVDAAQNVDGSCCLGVGYGTVPEFDDARTVEFWARPSDTGTRWAVGWGTREADLGFIVGVQSDGVRVDAWSDALVFPSPRPIADGRWHHVVVTTSGTTVAGYLDGAALGTAAFAGTLDTVNASGLFVGSSFDGAGPFYGDLDDVAVYPSALSATKVRTHFTAGGHTAPDAPAGVTATAGVNTVAVSWTAPGDDSTDPITSYRVTARRAGAVVAAVAAPAGATSARLSGLPGGAEVTVSVAAANAYGTGTGSAAVAATPTGPTTTYASAVAASAPSVYFRLGEAAGTPVVVSQNGATALNTSAGTLGVAGAVQGDADTAADSPAGCCIASGTAPLPTFGDRRTVEVWVRPTDSYPRWIAGWGGSDTDSAFNVGIADSRVLVDTYNDGLTFQGTRSLVDGNWHHVVVTYDGARVTAYVDGEAIGSLTPAGTIDTTDRTPLRIGAYSNGGSAFYGGIDELAIYRGALTATSVRAHFAASGHGVPAAAGGVTATAGVNRAAVRWTVPASPDPVRGYLVTAVAGGVARNARAVPAGTTSTVLTGLAGGTAYTIQVVARDAYGAGAAATSAAVTPTGAATTYASTVLADTPLAYYRLGDTGGSTVAADSAGGGHPAAYNRAALDRTGALSNDADTAVDADSGCCAASAISDLPAQNTARSVEVWVRPTDRYGRWVAGWGTSSTRRSFDVGVRDDRVLVASSGDDLSFPVGRTLVDGAWHHLVVTYDGAQVAAFVDGRPVGTGNFASTLHTVSRAPLNIGAFGDGGGAFYGGIDELAVYGVALSGAQVSAHFAASGRAAPPAVSGLTATARANAVAVKWTALPQSLAVTGYTVTTLVAGVPRNAVVVPPTATSAVITGLPGSTAVTVRVVATNSAGTGAAATSAAVTPTGATTTFASRTLADGPVAYYRLGESSGLPTAADSSGRAAPLAVQRGTWGVTGAVVGDADTAVNGDGGCCFGFATAPLPKFNSARTVSAWVRPTDGVLRFFAGWGTGNRSRMFDVGLQGDQVVVATYADDLYLPVGRSLVDGAWHQIVVTYDGSTATAYVDGVALTSQTFAARLNTVTDGTLTVGAGVGNDRPWYGDLDELAVFPTALSAAAVAAQFTASGHAAPLAPTSVTASARANAVAVSWAATTRVTDPATDYLVVARRGAQVLAAQATASTTRTLTLTGITAGAGVTVDVVAENAYGRSPIRSSAAVSPTGTATTYAGNVLAAQPVAYFRLGEAAGVVAGAEVVSGTSAARYGRATLGQPGALNADTDTAATGDGSCCLADARVAGLPAYDQARTVEFWARPTDQYSRWSVGWGTAATNQTFVVGVARSTVTVGTYSGDLTFDTTTQLDDGAWHQIVASYNGSVVQVYVDGALVGSQSPTFLVATTTNGFLRLGGSPDGGGNPTYGGLDDVAIYRTALSAATVAAHFAAR